MPILTPRPIIDKIVFRYNIRIHDHFQDCFYLMEKHWDEIQFGNQPPVWFQLSSIYPYRYFYRHEGTLEVEYSHTNLHLERKSSSYVRRSMFYQTEYGHKIKISPDRLLIGSLSKKGRKFGKSYLFEIPEFGILSIHRNTLKFTVNNHLLLRSQTTPGGLDRLLGTIYRKLWNVLGLWFFISDVDLAVDVAAKPSLMRDLRLVEARKHFLLAGPLVRHKPHAFRNTHNEDRNGITYGTRSSRFSATNYDRNILYRNSKPKKRTQLRQQRKFLNEIYGSRVPRDKNIVRLEFRLTDLVIHPPANSPDRPIIDQARILPSKHDWLHNKNYRPVYWDQLKLGELYRDMLMGLPILRSDLTLFKKYNTSRPPKSASAGHFTATNLRKIRSLKPQQWEEMQHPYFKILLRRVSKSDSVPA